jgi:hypothetical protein
MKTKNFYSLENFSSKIKKFSKNNKYVNKNFYFFKWLLARGLIKVNDRNLDKNFIIKSLINEWNRMN